MSHRLPTLHLMVGLPCSGKTTRARELERDLPAVRLSLDEWHLRLYGQDAADPRHDQRHRLVEDMLWDVAARTLDLGTDVVLDYGLWSRAERDDYRERAARHGARCRLHHLDVDEGELLLRLDERNRRPSKDSFVIDPDAMLAWFARFEPPTADEFGHLENDDASNDDTG